MKKRILILFLIGILFLINSQANITGAVVGISVSSGASSVLGLISIVIGLILFISDTEKEDLEKKLEQIMNVRTKRELLSDAHRAEELAKIEGSERLRQILVSEEVKNEEGIIEKFRKYKRIKKEDLDKYLDSKEFEEFREKALEKIKDKRLRQKILIEAVESEEQAEEGYDVNGLWDPNKDKEENERTFFEYFYDDIDLEISDGYRKWKEIDEDEVFNFYDKKNNSKINYEETEKRISRIRNAASTRNFGLQKELIEKEGVERKLKEKIKKSEEYKKFKEKALEAIYDFNEKINSGEFIPVFITEGRPSSAYPYKMQRMVYYASCEDLEKGNVKKGKGCIYYKKKRKKGDIIVAHEIVNPEAIENPEELNETPHIHWELKYPMKKILGEPS